MKRVDIVIHDIALRGKHLTVHNIKNRPPLIDTINENKIEQVLYEFEYFGIYDIDESGYRSQRYYHAPDLFKVLANKQFPVPNGLIQPLEQNKYKESIELLKIHLKDMLYLVNHDENPPQLVQEEEHQECFPSKQSVPKDYKPNVSLAKYNPWCRFV